ncbi:hypothetical protein WJX81_006656 [Elliptochloris bilobata]|uniref:starch synthase n=1 Tax=Elliptochloris bilobata TaxID=381761 RepID=A0AAW1RG52_9CHLO
MPPPHAQQSRKPSDADSAVATPGESSGNGASAPPRERRRGGRGFGTAAGNGNGGSDPRAAAAAKISAARRLARKLSEEKSAAVAAARQAAEVTMDEGEVGRLRASVEAASAEAAREAAAADAAARAARKGDLAAATLVENEALQALVVEVAANKAEARGRVAALKEKYSELLARMGQTVPEEVVLAAAVDHADATADAATDGRDRKDEIVQVMTALAVAREALAREGQLEARLTSLAQAASQSGSRIFTLPEEGAPVGGTATLYYNAAAGPLQRNAQALKLKAGLNAWAEMLHMELAPVEELPGWWATDLDLGEDVFRVDFVVADPGSDMTDNNGGANFPLRLLGAPTEAEVAERRQAAVEAAERERLAVIESKELALWDEQMAAAEASTAGARRRYRRMREEEMRREAEASVAAQRGPELAALRTEPGRQGVFAWAGGPPTAGESAVLAYNKAPGPLRYAADLVVHLGYDAWHQNEKLVLPLQQLPADEAEVYRLGPGDWWAAAVGVPPTAAALDWVLSDGAQTMWDNNNRQDFHTAVAGALSGAEYVERLYQAMAAEAADELAASEQRAAKRALRKAELKARAARKRRDLQRQVLYTLPVTPRAGEEVTVFYDPDATVLRGRPETWVRGCWNRWAHAQCFLPQRMRPVLPGGIGFHRASLQVPKDVWMMDMVFSDTGDARGGFYDSNNGLDYHVPVVGGTGSPLPLRVVHVSVEMAPIAKVGGMGDVVTALARAVQEEGHHVQVMLPKYDCLNYDEVRGLRLAGDFFFANVQVKVWEGEVEGLATVFLEPNNGNFWVGCIYGRADDARRFGFFCGAALEYLRHHAPAKPDIVHCHDWATAPVAFGNPEAAPVFTIHNLNYGADLIGRAMAASAVATTVSPTYAAEVSGHPAIAPHMSKFFGIRNGIDHDIWDPTEDRFLPRNYGVEDASEGKAAAKAELRRRMSLGAADVPVVAVVTRLTHQKGIHLIKHAAWRTLERGAQFVLLGSAPDPKVQADFNVLAGELARAYPDRARLWFAYDEPLSHLIYACADMLLVPSMFEPCGLTQMIAMRFGAVPVVRRTGGLNDTVFDVDHDGERAAAAAFPTNGFSFEGTDAAGLDYALNRALTAWYNDRTAWTALVRRIMEQDWSWSEPALDYIELYYRALKR